MSDGRFEKSFLEDLGFAFISLSTAASKFLGLAASTSLSQKVILGRWIPSPLNGSREALLSVRAATGEVLSSTAEYAPGYAIRGLSRG